MVFSTSDRKFSREKTGFRWTGLTFHAKGSGNIKYLRLTPKGEELAAAYVAPLVQADIHSFSAFSAEERSLLLKLMQQQLTSLKEYSEQLWN